MYYVRDTKPLEWWDGEDGCEVLGGRDIVGGGTWLACNKKGKIAFLTNVRQPPSEVHQSAMSRGLLPIHFLQSDMSPKKFAESIAEKAKLYNGFNLVVGDIPSKSMVYVSNGRKSDTVTVSNIAPGLHVLTNAALDTPWPKALRLRGAAERYLEEHDSAELSLEEFAQTLMTDTTKDDLHMLPGILSPQWESDCSSIFVEFDTPIGMYGTRSTSALVFSTDGQVQFFERSINMGRWETQCLLFQIANIY